jgi:hypothetical protein
MKFGSKRLKSGPIDFMKTRAPNTSQQRGKRCLAVVIKNDKLKM